MSGWQVEIIRYVQPGDDICALRKTFKASAVSVSRTGRKLQT